MKSIADEHLLGGQPQFEGEREKIAQSLKHLYKPKQRLRKKDRLLAKTILSVLEGYDGTVGRCFLCQKKGTIETDLELDHKDSIESHNEIPNLRLAHHTCNAVAYHKSRLSVPLEREKEKTVVSPWVAPPPWSSREGEKHDTMRARWNAWLNNPRIGPFSGQGGRIRVRDLAAMAVQNLGMGSMITYRRYIDEDRFGPLHVYRDDGVLWAEYRGGGSEPE